MASYGGTLSFELQYTLMSDHARALFDTDVELIVSIASLHPVYTSSFRMSFVFSITFSNDLLQDAN